MVNAKVQIGFIVGRYVKFRVLFLTVTKAYAVDAVFVSSVTSLFGITHTPFC